MLPAPAPSLNRLATRHAALLTIFPDYYQPTPDLLTSIPDLLTSFFRPIPDLLSTRSDYPVYYNVYHDVSATILTMEWSSLQLIPLPKPSLPPFTLLPHDAL